MGRIQVYEAEAEAGVGEKRLDEKGPRIARKSLRRSRRSGSRIMSRKGRGKDKMKQPDRSRRFRRLWEIMTRGTMLECKSGTISLSLA